MRSKEEILNKHGRLISGPALQAMDEFAKEQSVSFGEWIAENEWHMLYATNVWESIRYKEQYPTEQLFSLFLFEQSRSQQH